MSVDSGLSGPVEGPTAPAAPRASTAPSIAPRAGSRRADAIADAVSAPSFRSNRGRPRRQGRRVTRIVRRIELWSVLKIALVFNTIMLGVALGTVALLWALASTTGLVDDLEGFLRDAGFEDFRFRGAEMFEQVAFIGAVGALAATVFMVLSAALVNLISEITGGIRFVVIEEIVDAPAAESARPPAPLPLPTSPPASPPAPSETAAARGGPSGAPSSKAGPRAPKPSATRSPRPTSPEPADPAPRSSRRSGAAPSPGRSRTNGSGSRASGSGKRSGSTGSRSRGGRRPPTAPLRPAADADDRTDRPEAAT